MARKKRREKSPTSASANVGLGSLGDLLGAHGFASSEPAPVPSQAGTPAAAKPGRVVVRKEKKVRKGKTVTTLTGHGLEPSHLAELGQRLRKSLGCGSGIEDQALVLQGDQRAAVSTLLTGEGWKVKKG